MSYDRSSIAGKISVLTTLLGVFVVLIGLVIDLPHGTNFASANNATTSVTVLNTPPVWTQNVQEEPGSSTSTPTNSGSTLTWTAIGTDSSNDSYYLLICKNYASATPNASAAPTCSGGNANQWAISALTTSGVKAYASTSTLDGAPFNVEFNNWYGYICDGATVNPRCNDLAQSGNGTTSSPFVINHRPSFTIFLDTSPKDPGQVVTWYSTSSDSDTYSGASQDRVKLFVCKAADFTGTDCGAGGTWATSSFVTADASSTYTLPSPQPDGNFASYGYIIDEHGNHTPSGATQGSNSVMTVNNMTPSIAAGSVSLLDTDDTGPLTLTVPAGQTTGFEVQYTVTDQNSCSTTAQTAEIISPLINVYRSGITQAGCDASAEYDANFCYPGSVAAGYWAPTCVASSTSCLGQSDSDVIWSCTFPLWYVADPTDGTGIATDPPHWAEDWRASVQAADDDFATSSLVEGSSGNELNSAMFYSVSTTSIAYGGLQPGQDTGTIGNTALDRTDIRATGNVGLDTNLYGADMCPTYPTCTGYATSTIYVNNQKYGTSSVAYSAPEASALSALSTQLELNVASSTSTTTPASQTIYWGIAVPIAITLSGDYIGVNTLEGVTGESASW